MLKENELKVNQESISMQTRKDLVNAWYDIAKSYFHQAGFDIYDEKYVNKNTCKQFKAKKLSEKEHESYVWKSFVTGRITINSKLHRKQFLENRLAELEECFGICFQIKDAKVLSKKDELLLEKINNEREESLDLFIANVSENDAEYNEGTCEKNYNYEIQQHDEAKNINHENFRLSNVNTNSNAITKTQVHKRSFTVMHNTSPKQKPIILKQNNTPKTPEKTSPRKIITTQTKEQKNFNDKIESEQVKLSDEFSKLRNDMNIFQKEMRDCYKKEIDS